MTAACAVRGAPRPASGEGETQASYLGVAAFPAGALGVPGSTLPLGGISGLAFDAQTGRWVGASDVRPPRLVWFDVSAPDGRLAVAPVTYTLVTAAPALAQPDVVRGLSMESLVVMPDGLFVTTNEGYTDRNGVAQQPAVLHLTRAGEVVGVTSPPAHFTITAGEFTHGVRHNLGLESLTRTPNGRLVTGLEQPLAQDGPISTSTRGGRVRLLEFLARGGSWRAGREWVYPLDPTPHVPGYDKACPDGENGLSELLALDDHRFIAVERACLLGAPDAPALNPVRLYVADVSRADDVSGVPALGARAVRPAAKRLLIDLMTTRTQLPALMQTLSNFEALAIGPPSPGAPHTLLLASDDNFRATQALAFLWLRLEM